MTRWLVKTFLTSVLFILEIAFGLVKKRVLPLFPYDKQTKKIMLPSEEKKKVRHLVVTGHKIEAVRRVTQLTGANLRVAKVYVDSLV